MSDREFLLQFEACAIPRVEWTHAAHVRMAWLYLRDHPPARALARIRRGIQKLNASYGNKTGYHETVTRAFANLIAAAMAGDDPSATFTQFKRRHRELFFRRRPALLDYYRPATLKTPAAAKRFLKPDLKPLPSTNGKPQRTAST